MNTSVSIPQPQNNLPQTIPEEKHELIRSMFARGCTNDEFQVLIELANRYQLDPFAKQIWAVKYGSSPAQIFAGRDGYLAIAHRSGQFNGMQSEVDRDADGNILSATCRVWRKDMEHPFERTVFIDEYNTKKGVWAEKPATMIVKVAEAQALRLAFNVSGLYDSSEFKEEEPYKVEPQPTDIVVEPIVVETPEPAAAPTPTPASKQAAPAPKKEEPSGTPIPQSYADIYKDNFEAQGFDTSVFTEARLPNGLYIKEMIEASFREQKANRDAQKAAEAIPVKPVFTCDTCGKHLSDDEYSLTLKADVDGMYCPQCLAKAIRDQVKKQKCNCCGKTLLPEEAEKALKLYSDLTCAECRLMQKAAELKKE